MNNHEAKQFVEAIYQNIWAAKDLSKFADYYHPELSGVVYQPDGVELEIDYPTVERYAHALAHERRNVETTLESIIGQDNRIVFHFKQRSVMLKDSRVFNLRTAGEYELEICLGQWFDLGISFVDCCFKNADGAGLHTSCEIAQKHHTRTMSCPR